ncbi:MAG: YciI family protein [Bacteroidia bacterium]|nr:YciI family protein [Bacteroidia bacterium]
MKEYLLVFRNIGGDNQYVSTPEDMMEDMPRWQAWIGHIAAQGKLISTQPIDYQGSVVSNAGVSRGPYMEGTHLVVGYLLCRAESDEEVMGWSRTCPVLRYPQASVEIRPVMPFAA